MRKLLLGSFLAALAVFCFGAAYWINSPSQKIFGVANQSDALARSLMEHLPATGTYTYPAATLSSTERDAASRKGPIAIIHFQREGMPAMDPATLGRGFLVTWVTMALLGWLLQFACPSLPTYGSRVLFATVTGLLVAANSDLGATVWWWHSAPFAAASALYNVLAFLLGGLILARFIRRA